MRTCAKCGKEYPITSDASLTHCPTCERLILIEDLEFTKRTLEVTKAELEHVQKQAAAMREDMKPLVEALEFYSQVARHQS
jgi:DNA-directed RNA polymerase subunit RPC12/RpoP